MEEQFVLTQKTYISVFMQDSFQAKELLSFLLKKIKKKKKMQGDTNLPKLFIRWRLEGSNKMLFIINVRTLGATEC